MSFIKFDDMRSSSLMRCRSSDLMKYSSSNLTRCRLSDLMKSRLARIKFDESLSSSLMSRFRQVWWVAFVEFDDSSRQALVISKNRIRLRSSFRKNSNRTVETWTMRWSNMITKTNSQKYFLQKKKIWKRISRSHFTFRDKTQKHVINIFTTSRVFRKKHSYFNLLQKRKIVRRKTAYNRHVLEKKKNKNFQNN
jgi:hypothetical protein